MRMFRCLVQGQHRGKADIASLQQGLPFSAATAGKGFGEFAFYLRPARPVHLCGQTGILQSHAGDELAVEFSFQRPDGDVFPVAGLIHIVKGRPAVEQIAFPPACIPKTGRHHAMEHRGQGGNAIDHRRIDHLPGA